MSDEFVEMIHEFFDILNLTNLTNSWIAIKTGRKKELTRDASVSTSASFARMLANFTTGCRLTIIMKTNVCIR
jgi:hypothetical protein